jgi:ABC-type amino acid transport substrate-binding protein
VNTKALLPFGLALLATCSTAFAGPILDRVTRSGELTGVLMESYPPFSFLNEQNQLDGFDVDVAKAVAQRLGVKLTLFLCFCSIWLSLLLGFVTALARLSRSPMVARPTATSKCSPPQPLSIGSSPLDLS